MLFCNIAFHRFDKTAQTSNKRKSADYRHTLSWLTTSHNSLWEGLRHQAHFPNKNWYNSVLARW